MKFKLKNTEITLSFTFFAVILTLLCMGELKICVYSLLSATLHEIAHVVCIFILGGNITKITFTAFGANIIRGSTLLPDFKEAVISYCAPVFNLVLCLILYKQFPTFAIINLVIGLLNLLPFYDFDGGRGLGYLLKYFLSKEKAQVIIAALSVTVTIAIAFAGVYVFIHYKRNLTLVFLSIYMILGLFVKTKPKY